MDLIKVNHKSLNLISDNFRQSGRSVLNVNNRQTESLGYNTRCS